MSSLNSEEEAAGLFIVSEVLDHRLLQDGKIDFLVACDGYDESENSWEPEESLTNMAASTVWRYWFTLPGLSDASDTDGSDDELKQAD